MADLSDPKINDAIAVTAFPGIEVGQTVMIDGQAWTYSGSEEKVDDNAPSDSSGSSSSSSKADDNQKLPDSDVTWEYPWNQVRQTAGGHETHYNSTPGKESHREFHPGGTYHETSTNGKRVALTANKDYKVVSEGASKAVGGAKDEHTKGGNRHNTEGGVHSEIAKDKSGGLFGALAEVIKGMAYQHTKGPKTEIREGGTLQDNNDGDNHHNVLGDKVTFIQGTKYEQISGEHGTHLPSGNMDVQLDSGKYRMKTGNDILIESDTKITFKVGSSTIVMEPGKVTITASEIDHVQA